VHNQGMPLSVILSEVSNANEAEGSRTGSRKRTRYRFLVREALTSYARVSPRKGGEGDRTARTFTLISPSPSGKVLGVRRPRSHPAPKTGVGGLIKRPGAVRNGAANRQSSAHCFAVKSNCAGNGAQTLTPCSPSPRGKGKNTTGLRTVISPSPPFPGERGNRTPSSLGCGSGLWIPATEIFIAEEDADGGSIAEQSTFMLDVERPALRHRSLPAN